MDQAFGDETLVDRYSVMPTWRHTAVAMGLVEDVASQEYTCVFLLRVYDHVGTTYPKVYETAREAHQALIDMGVSDVAWHRKVIEYIDRAIAGTV